VFLLNDQGAVLLQHRDNKPGLPHANLWVPPGGHCENGEAEEECARREFQEETSYRCGPLHWLDQFEDQVAGFPPYVLTVFWASYDGEQCIVCGEGQAIEFINREHADRYSIPPYIMRLWDRALAASGAAESQYV
jgi:8-oxo-dGTP pyrophosphatase MutT (NUDIX family)